MEITTILWREWLFLKLFSWRRMTLMRVETEV